MVETPIYMDYQATTPLDPRVLQAMMPFFQDRFGNPHSVTHRFGWEAEASVNAAREHVADVIGARAEDIIFTSGATETNNLVIKGIMQAYGGQKNHLITVETEHKCVLEAAHAVEQMGGEVTYLPVRPDGLIDPDELEKAITDRTALVSVMAVNNEIGVIQPIADIGAICRARDVLFHTDAAQAFGKIALDVDDMNIDLMSISGHKIYGPKGIGALYRRKAEPPIRLAPQMAGGGQEDGVRSGTLSPALCVGLGEAARIAGAEMDTERPRIEGMMHSFYDTIRTRHPGIILNGSAEQRFWGNLNVSFPGLDGDLLISKLRGLAVSSGAACASATTGPSYVLQAIGRSDDLAKSSIRFGIGRFTTEEEMDYAARLVCETIDDMGGLKPAEPAAEAVQ